MHSRIHCTAREAVFTLSVNFSCVLAALANFGGGSDGNESAHHAGDLGPIPGLGRSPAEGNGNPPQYSCLENPRDRGAWWATVHGVAELDMTEAT